MQSLDSTTKYFQFIKELGGPSWEIGIFKVLLISYFVRLCRYVQICSDYVILYFEYFALTKGSNSPITKVLLSGPFIMSNYSTAWTDRIDYWIHFTKFEM